MKAPGVYRFICPDGRSYVGAARDIHNRGRGGLGRRNSRIDKALESHPSETWTFEVLEELPAGCSETALQRAEQCHIERLSAFLPERRFDVLFGRPGTTRWTMPKLFANAKMFHLAVPIDWTERIDDWRRRQPDVPSVAEALRRLIDLGLKQKVGGKR
jgi:hypothetical protein